MGRRSPKGSFKDPSLTTSARVLRALFSRTTGGVLASAAAVQWLAPAVSSGRLPLPVGVGGEHSWPVLVGSAALGFGAGVAAVQTLQWARLKAIAALLDYKGWMFNQKAKSTMLWGLALKLLVGPGPHRLHDFTEAMPHLPVPDLDDTCRRFLITVKPLLTPEEFEKTKSLVEDLQKNDGPRLQEYLKKKYKKTKNWLADWWLRDAYLARRDPIALNVNFFMMGAILPDVSSNNLARCANIIYDTISYYLMIKDGSLPPDMVMHMIPTCMEGVRYMLAATRIPDEKCDTLRQYPDSTHIIILCKGHYFVMDMFPQDSSGKRRRLNKHEIKAQTQLIWQQSRVMDTELPMAALTTQDRTQWAKDRLLLARSNKEVLELVESSIFMVVFAEDKPESISLMAKRSIAGDGSSRWFDKSLVLEVWNHSAMGGGNMEHSGTDATHFAVMWEHVLQLEEYAPDGDLLPLKRGETVRTDLPRPELLTWNVNDELRTRVQKSYADFKQRSEELDLIIHHSEFGRTWMKSKRVSPDGFIQMGIQLAYWRLHKTFTKTYEPASHRLFTLGRTDNINPVSEESIAYVHKMEDPSVPPEDKIAALKAAIEFQSKVRLEATAGFGCDRHMLGLECAAKELGITVPEVFNDKAYKLPMNLSTSQVPVTLGHMGLDLIPESIAGGFGPTSEEGYGVLYCSVGDNMFNFSITSWKSCPQTDSARFADALRQAMGELKDLLDGKTTAQGANL